MIPLFICAIEDNTMVLCEEHAKVFEIAAMTAMTPHTIYELEDTDTGYHITKLRKLLWEKAVTDVMKILKKYGTTGTLSSAKKINKKNPTKNSFNKMSLQANLLKKTLNNTLVKENP